MPRDDNDQELRWLVAAELFRWQAEDDFPAYSVSHEELPSGRTRLASFDSQAAQTRELFLEGADVVLEVVRRVQR